MKRKGIMAFCVAAMLIAAPVQAVEVDVTGLEMEELLEIRQMIETELMERLAGGASTISSGVYVAGKDIKPAKFNITFTEYAVVALYATEEEYKTAVSEHTEEEKAMSVTYLEEGDEFYVGLEEGMVMWITTGTGIVTDASKSTWAME